MAGLATMVFKTHTGAQLALEPHSGKTGAVGIFMPREGVDQFFPLPKFAEQYAESPDTEGGRRVLSETQNAIGAGSVIVAGDDQTTFRTWHQRWQGFVEEMRREGGTLTYTPSEGVAVTYEIESMKITDAKYDGVQMLAFVQEFGFEFTCRPFGLLSSEEQTLRDHDPFSRDSIGAGEWATFDAGSGTLSVTGGQLVPSSTATKRLYRFGLKVADSSGVIKVTTGASVASGVTGVVLKRASSTEHLRGQVSFSGAATSHLKIIKRVAGVDTTIVETGSFTTAAATTYWLKFLIVGNTAEVQLYTGDPETGVAPVQTLSTVLAAENATKFGEGVWGNAGLYLEPQAVDYRWDEWRLDAKQVRASNPLADFELPGVPGHVPALGDVSVTDTSTQPRAHVEIGIETADSYVASQAPPNIVDSDQLITSGYLGTGNTRSGAFDPLASGNSVVRATLSPTPIAVCATALMSHVGPLRPKTRVFAAGTGPVYVRVSSRYGAGQPQRGEWKRVPTTGEFCEVDLGLVNPPPAVLGEQGWEAVIESLSETTGDTIDVDYMLILGASKYAKSKVAVLYEVPTSVQAEDGFVQTEGTLSGKALGASRTIVSAAPGTIVNAALAGVGEVPWTSPENAKTSNDTWASAALADYRDSTSTLYETTQYLQTSKHGFAIPAGATVSGIQVEVEKHGSHTEDYSMKIVKAGVTTGTEHAAGGLWAPYTDGISVYGSETDLWGTTWTPAQINEEGFGVAFAGRAAPQPSEVIAFAGASVDAITITVYYTPSGGNPWTEAGHEPVYKVIAATARVKREGTGDAANTGRIALAGTSEPTTLALQTDVKCSVSTGVTGLIARYVNTTNWLAVVVTENPYKVRVLKLVGGVLTTLNKPTAGLQTPISIGEFLTLRLQVDSFGRWIVWGNGAALGQGQDSALATGGTLAKGKTGLYDEHSAAAVSEWDNFKFWVPELNSVMWTGRTARFRWADGLRESNSGGLWSRLPGFEGSRVRVPPAGPAGLTSRLAVKARRLNVDETVDPFISDEIQVSMRVTPRVVLLG